MCIKVVDFLKELSLKSFVHLNFHLSMVKIKIKLYVNHSFIIDYMIHNLISIFYSWEFTSIIQ